MNAQQSQTFDGTYTPRLDDKSRITLPAQWRELVEGGIVLTRGQANCVFGLMPAAYDDLVAQIRALPFTHPGAQNYARMMSSGAARLSPDKQGRVAVPPALRKWAAIERDCTVIGVMDRFEIWDTERWEQFEQDQAEAFAMGDVMPGSF